MGTTCSRPARDGILPQLSAFPPAAPAVVTDAHQPRESAIPATSAAPPVVTERPLYDEDMRRHLLSHSSSRQVQLTLYAATIFVARARHAHAVVEQRRRESGCASQVPWSPTGPSRREAEAAHLRERMSREEKIEDGLLLLRQRIELIKVKVVHMEDDGNCMFRSLAHELYGDQHLHAAVRLKVVQHMRARADSYSFFVGDTTEWEQYLRKMTQPRTWGDDQRQPTGAIRNSVGF